VRKLPGHTQALLSFIDSRDTPINEGFVNLPQLAYFRTLLRNSPDITAVVEVGFNAGVSTENFLFARPDVLVVSFDIGVHTCVSIGKSYIDGTYPGRHELILGDSRYTISKYRNSHPNRKFDLIFLDGGHSYEEAFSDIVNMRFMAGEDALVVMDDLTPWQPWGMGALQGMGSCGSRRGAHSDYTIAGRPADAHSLRYG
jgi:predicted O-methyltransferase YrrM